MNESTSKSPKSQKMCIFMKFLNHFTLKKQSDRNGYLYDSIMGRKKNQILNTLRKILVLQEKTLISTVFKKCSADMKYTICQS